MSPRTKKIHRRIARVAFLTLALALLGLFVYAQMNDGDDDGIPDGFESLFGLDRNADDSAGDPDQDGLSNLEESLLGTDPFNADTDRDGWNDAADADPVSRAVFPWGEPRFTFEAQILYTWPPWVIGAQAEGGQWIDEAPWGWMPEDGGSRLLMRLDRTQISNDLWLAVAAPGAVAGDYMASLCDTNLAALAAPITLVPAEAPWLTNRLPLAAYPAAAVVSLFSTQGLAHVTISMLYADADGDGLDDLQAADGDPDHDGLTNQEERQCGTDPTRADSDGDGLPDGWELVHGFNPSNSSDASTDLDGDGLSTLQEYELGSDPHVADTDGDGMADGWEIAAGFDPLCADAGAVPERGMVLWLRADDLVASNAVALWPDRSGWSHDVTQTVSSCRPVALPNAVNGRPAVEFDGANDTLAGQVGGITGAVSVVAVCRFEALNQAVGDYDYVLNMGEDQALKHLSVSRCAAGYASGWDDAYYSYMGGSAGSVRGSALPGQYGLAIIAVHATNGTAHTVWVNGVAEAAQQYAGALTLNGGIDLGRFAKPGYANHYLHGRIAEVFVYDRALGTNECQTLYAYLQDRYALKREGCPEVQAGADRQILEGQTANLDGTVSDDGQPNPPGQVTCQWTKTAGPGEVSFADATAPQTTAGFSQSGAYMLRLTASDGSLTAFDEVQVTVSVPASTNVPTSGLRLWLKADELPLADGAPVAAWRDAGGQGHDLSQAAVAAQPVFRTNALAGRPAVEFDGANDTLAGQVGGITGAVSVVAVCRFEALNQAVGDYDYVLNMGEDQALKHLSVSRCAAGYASGWDDAYYSYMGGAQVSMRGPVLPGRQWMTIAAVHSPSGTAHTVYLNGAPVWAQQYAGALTLDGGIDLGRFAKPGYANHYLHGRIAEALVYDRALQARDLLEIHAYLRTKYGVPEVSDVDGDGLSDALEARLGTDPLTSNACARLPFLERFEPDTCAVGDLHGQHGWEAWPSQAAVVQTNAVYEGAQALALCATNDEPAAARQLFAGTASQAIWFDFRLMATVTAVPTGNVDGAAACLVDANGRLVVLDGRLNGANRWVALTNHPAIAMDRWIRLTTRLDYASQTWSICLDGIQLAKNLGFGTPCDQLRDLRLIQGNADNISISIDVPAGLSLDGDRLPDDWELASFGNLEQADDGDPDHDGLTNFQEFQHGSNPLNSDTDGDGLLDGPEVLTHKTSPLNHDTDGDGMPDGWETAYGLAPTNAADAAQDDDGDGLANLAEWQHGAQPNRADTDGDGLSDGVEVNTHDTNPLAADTDGDGYRDGAELARGTDPLSAASYPASQWGHKRKVFLRAGVVTAPLCDAPVLALLDSNRLDYAQCLPGGEDLLFTDADGAALDFEIEAWNPGGNTPVWVRMPRLGGSNAPAYFWMHWGNPAATNAVNPAGVWRGYAGVWHLSETNGLFADSACGYTATNFGALCVTGFIGQARKFRGTDSLLAPSGAFAGISNAVTISFWQYGATNQPQNVTCFEGVSGVGRELNAHVPWGDGNVYWDAFGNYDRIYKAAASNIYKGAWNHWTFVKDRVSGVMTVYVNGELWHSGTGRTRAYTPVTAFRFGAAANGSCGYMGLLDELRVETVARTPEWIRFQRQTMSDEVLIYGEQQVKLEVLGGAAEPDAAATLVVIRLCAETNFPLVVRLAAAGGSATAGADYALPAAPLVIPAGATQATGVVTALDDYWLEGAETARVCLAMGDYYPVAGASTVVVVIADNDLDTDADGLCDDWEMAQFGSLDETGADDADSDGLVNLQEYLNGTDPLAADTDGDGMPDGWEVAHSLNPSAAADAGQDADGDGLPNLGEYRAGTDPGNPASHCWTLSGRVDYGGSQTGAIHVLVCSSSTGWTAVAQATIMTTGSYAVTNLPPNSNYWVKAWRDTDGNGTNDPREAWGAFTNHLIALLANVAEVNFALTDPDSDGDGLPDWWEVAHNLNPLANDSALDPDQDGLTNLQEFQHGTDLLNHDTDGDGMPDGWETAYGLAPTNAADAAQDDDGDGLANLAEWQHGAQPNRADTDGDGLSDGVEVNTHDTNPLAADTDGDGYRDGAELARGTDPLSAASYPASQWGHKRKVFLRAGVVTAPLCDAPVLALLDSNRLDYAQCLPGGEDLLFTDADGAALDFEIEAWNPGGNTPVWVRMPCLGGSNAPAYFWMHWGNPAATNAVNPAGVWQSYAGVWHLSETNDVFADSAPGQYDAYNIGAVCVTGVLGNARNFRGSDSIIVPPEAFASISNAVTISFWQYGATDQPRNDICFEGISSAGRELIAHIPWGDGNVYWDAFGNYDRLYKAATTNEYKGGWNHWTFTKDRVTGTMAIYLNGELWTKATGKTRAYTPVTSFGLGSAANGTFGYMGRMDEVRVETVARSPAWTRFQYRTMLDQVLIYGEQQVSIAGAANAAEPGQSGEFTVSRTAQNTNLPLTVTLAVPSGTATEGADYALLPRTVVIPAGSLQTTLAVPVLDDLWLEGAETVTVSLAQGNYFIDPAQAVAAIVIADDDQDTDADGQCDAWEIQHFGNLDVSADADADGDGVSNRDEYLHGTDPHTADTDGDGLPDAWEIAWGTHPLVADASADPDYDGLTNMQEYQDGTNPLSADGDGDGLPDLWELAHGLDPANASDAALDPDHDGLANLGEYRAGTDRLNPDTDGDGLTDGDEVNVWHTNPLSADTDGDGMPDAWEVARGLNPLYSFDADQDTDHDGLNNIEEYRAGTNPFVLETLPGGSASSFLGSWEALDSAFVCLGRGGHADYALPVPNAGDFGLAVDVRDYNPLTVGASFDLTIHVDGIFVGRQIVRAARQTATGTFFLPYLEAAVHTVRVTWNNPLGGHALAIVALRLQTFNGPDEDNNGQADWLDHRRLCALMVDSPAAVSLVSPVCIEGASWSFDTLRVESSYVPDGVAAPVPKHGVGNGWYVDVVLSPTNATGVSIAGNNGAASWTNTIVWCALNLLDPAATNVPALRRNDALLLTACPAGATNGDAQVDVWLGEQWITNLFVRVGEPVPYRFESDGSYRLIGVYSNENLSTNAGIAIVVTAGSFGGDPYCRVKQVRDWLCPGMPTNAVIEYDADLSLGSSPLAGGGRTFRLRTDTVDDRHVVARLGEDGPVLDSATVRGIVMDSSAYGTVDIIETYPDGSRLVEVSIWMSAVPADLRMSLNIFVGGVLFDDGTRTRIVTAEDFNAFGEYRYRMVQGPTVKTSVCHTTSIYDGATYIGGP